MLVLKLGVLFFLGKEYYASFLAAHLIQSSLNAFKKKLTTAEVGR